MKTFAAPILLTWRSKIHAILKHLKIKEVNN